VAPAIGGALMIASSLSVTLKCRAADIEQGQARQAESHFLPVPKGSKPSCD